MCRLPEVFRRHRDVLGRCGWTWDEAEVSACLLGLDEERLALAAELLDRWIGAAPEDFVSAHEAFFGARRHVAPGLLGSILTFREPLLLVALAEPRCGTVEEMVSISKPLLERDARLAVQWTSLIADGLPERGLEFPDDMLARALNIVERTAALGRLTGLLVQLLRNPNPRVRSKAALLLGRSCENPALLFDRCLQEPDARVRANLVEGLWNIDADGKREALWKAAQDPHHRVAANALVGLSALGDPGAAIQLEKMAADHSPETRAAAAWAMGVTQDQRYIDTLHRMFKADCGGPRRNALRALVRIRHASA